MSDFGLFGGFPRALDGPPRDLDGYLRGHRQSPIAGASRIWGVGRSFFGDRTEPLVVSWADIHRDTAWAARLIAEIGVGRDDFCYVGMRYAHGAQIWPFQAAIFQAGARFATGQQTGWDAYRLDLYCRLFPVRLAFGISPAALDGLEALGKSLLTVFAGVGVVVALPGAWERLRVAGFNPWRMIWLGPMLALDPGDGGGARFDQIVWRLDQCDGEILLTNRGERATRFDAVPTGVQGAIRTIDGSDRLFITC